MSQPITDPNHGMRLMGVLQNNVDLEEVPDSVVEWALQHPKEAGKQFTAFLRNGCRMFFGATIFVINRLKSFSPSDFINPGWTIWRGTKKTDGLKGKEKQDARSLALKEVDWSKVLFETCLKKGETRITGENKLIRLEGSGSIILDAGISQDLFFDYQSNKDNSVLEKLRRERGIKYLDFFGTILRSPDGSRYVMGLCWIHGLWDWRVHCLNDTYYDNELSAVIAS